MLLAVQYRCWAALPDSRRERLQPGLLALHCSPVQMSLCPLALPCSPLLPQVAWFGGVAGPIGRRKWRPAAEEPAMQAADDAPVACTLSSEDLGLRLAWIRQVTSANLLSHRLTGTKLQLTYRQGAKRDLEQIVDRERECCAFLRFELREVAGTVELTIEAPSGVGEEARWLFDQFMPSADAGTNKRACGCGPGVCG